MIWWITFGQYIYEKELLAVIPLQTGHLFELPDYFIHSLLLPILLSLLTQYFLCIGYIFLYILTFLDFEAIDLKQVFYNCCLSLLLKEIPINGISLIWQMMLDVGQYVQKVNFGFWSIGVLIKFLFEIESYDDIVLVREFLYLVSLFVDFNACELALLFEYLRPGL